MILVLLLFFSSVLSQQCSDLSPNERLPCWSWYKYDLNEEKCLERDCCWSPSILTTTWCYYRSPKTEITNVHVIQGSHLDVGFLKTAPEIINLWFHTHFPRAYALGKQFETNGQNTTAGLKFTSQSWLISLFFNCPSNYVGVICPNTTLKAMIQEAIQKDWLTWHAFPFNGEMEIMDPSLIEFGIKLTHDLDLQFGKKQKTVLSQRDVPGMTASTISILLANNVTAISIGVNGGSTPPDTAQSFIWKNPQTNQTILTFYLQGGYSGRGGILPWDKFAWTGVPGSSHIMVVDWRGDNAGPPDNINEILADWESLKLEFPNANIFPSTFDYFVESVSNIPDSNFPLIEKEIGDSWIHGVASDPLKLSKMKIIQDLRSKCLNDGSCKIDDPIIWSFSRFLLKNGEHTWGLDNKVTLPKYVNSNWTNQELEKIIKPSPEGKKIVESWKRQRAMGIDLAIDELKDHPLKNQILQSFKNLIPVYPSLDGFTKIELKSLPTYFSIGPNDIKIGFNNVLASINYLTIGNNRYSDIDHTLGQLEYRTYDGTDYRNFMLGYNYLYFLYEFDDLYDYDKVNIDDGGAMHRVLRPSLRSFYFKDNTDSVEFLLMSQWPGNLPGTPEEVWTHYTVCRNTSIFIDVLFFNKTSTRLPESTFFRFTPWTKPGTQGKWKMEKLGEYVDPGNVVTGGAKHLHSTSGDLEFTTDATLKIGAMNSPLVSFGEPNAFPTPTNEEPDFDQGASFVLHNNLWNTNYIMWYPFEDVDQNLVFRYHLHFDK